MHILLYIMAIFNSFSQNTGGQSINLLTCIDVPTKCFVIYKTYTKCKIYNNKPKILPYKISCFNVKVYNHVTQKYVTNLCREKYNFALNNL